MLNDLTFLIPVFDLADDRLLNFKYSTKRIRDTGYPVVVAEQLRPDQESNISKFCRENGIRHHRIIIDSDYINKSTIINRATKTITTDYVWMNDADCILPFSIILEEKLTGSFIQPYKFIKRLDENTTSRLRSGKSIEVAFTFDLLQKSNYISGVGYEYISLPMAASFIYKRNDFIEMGGMDETYIGWGYEDNDFVTRLFLGDFKNEFSFIETNGIHLWHPIDSERDQREFNKLYYDTKFSEQTRNNSKNIWYSYMLQKTCNVLTLFRGDFGFLNNIDMFLSEEVVRFPVSLTWIVNTQDEEFITEVYNRSKKYNDVRIIVNRETLKLTDRYYDHRHEYITNIYSNVFPTINSNYICTFEDDMIPPSGSFVKLFNKVAENPEIGAAAAIYNSKDLSHLACCTFLNTSSRLPTELVKNNGWLEGIRTGGGFTIWNNDAIKKILPIRFKRVSEDSVVGWDWFCSEQLILSGFKILLDTDSVCEHLNN